jgi:AbrB family looped-hinge helix DNA binding protein
MIPRMLNLAPLTSKLTSKGQVTIPVQIRQLLGLAPHGSVAFYVTEAGVTIGPIEDVITRTAGMLKSDIPMASPREEKEAAEIAMAEEAESYRR